ncbi:PepSY domain-containing protein [Shewanella gelidii]|uniref:PepSY domain-containing protein n=1 Tax=Shewanella gelidii TaxID=1642821 RepID=A0A917N756_9GAMM|nr:PepSY domain-containing protein [Shewanella gelidii]MCL1097187.1 PepSY domain-containing protein [Shewanella gelidii]GGI73137.1 hypothetical protein GCM10009332_08330 [Shewanella gelidii]
MKIAKAILLGCVLCLIAPVQAAISYGNQSFIAVTIAGASIKNEGKNSRLRVKSGKQAVQMVKQRYAGKVLKVSSANVGGSPGYRVKLLSNDGQVFYVGVNAQTGAMSR